MIHPVLYEINTRCWLKELSRRGGRSVTLGAVPDGEFSRWLELGFTHIWLMGVWSGGPKSRVSALAPEMLQNYRRALPDCSDADVSCSPYAVAGYAVSEELGGTAGLRSFRAKLRERGMKLVLDFVPNHVGLDHSWLTQRPDLFVQSPTQMPGTYGQQTPAGLRWLAHGKDPYFPPWADTVQLDYRNRATRSAMIETLQSIAQQCDGVRCDMAMLELSDVFARTWASFPVVPAAEPAAGKDSPEEFWQLATGSVRKLHPEFLFLAEAYWGLEPRLQALGFNYTYDKSLYDHLVHRNAAAVQHHLHPGNLKEVASNAHFLENHDEPRIASLLSTEELRVATFLVLALPGMRFLHEGQLEGARIRIPVQLLRRPAEATDAAIAQLNRQLLLALQKSSIGRGDWNMPALREAWSGNPTAQNIIVVRWQAEPASFSLAMINLAPHRSQCYAQLSAQGLADHDWRLVDLLGKEEYRRSGKDLAREGLYLDLPEHAAQLFHFKPVT